MPNIQCYFDPVRKVWSGKQYVPIFNPNASIGHVILSTMERNPDKIIQICADSGVQYTNKDIRTRAIRTALFLSKQNLVQGDVVGIIAANSTNLTPIVVACFASGLPFSSLDTSFEKSDIMCIFGTTKPKIVFSDAVCYTLLKQSLEEIGLTPPIYIVHGHIDKVPNVVDFMENEDESIENYVSPILDEPKSIAAAILCSSGTTGQHKSVKVSQTALSMCAELTPVKSNDVLLCFSTIDWYSGVWVQMLSLLFSATRIITTEKVSSSAIIRLIDKYQVTFFMSPPTQMASLLQAPNISAQKLASLRTYLCGGSRVLPSLIHRMNKYLKNCRVSVMYGMTEVGTVCTINPGNEPLESVGLPHPNMQVKIVDDGGSVADSGVEGEVYLKPPFPFLGYCGMPEQTKAICDKDGWIHSGDVGYFDTNGYLILVDRKNDILKHGETHYFPSEIENVLLEIPDIAQTCVCGVPDENGSDIPAALVIKAPGSSITEEYIFQYTMSRLPEHKRIRAGIYFTDSIPMTPCGKYRRHIVRDICQKFYMRRQDTATKFRANDFILV